MRQRPSRRWQADSRARSSRCAAESSPSTAPGEARVDRLAQVADVFTRVRLDAVHVGALEQVSEERDELGALLRGAADSGGTACAGSLPRNRRGPRDPPDLHPTIGLPAWPRQRTRHRHPVEALSRELPRLHGVSRSHSRRATAPAIMIHAASACHSQILRPGYPASAMPAPNWRKARHFRPLRNTRGAHNGQSDNPVRASTRRAWTSGSATASETTMTALPGRLNPGNTGGRSGKIRSALEPHSPETRADLRRGGCRRDVDSRRHGSRRSRHDRDDPHRSRSPAASRLACNRCGAATGGTGAACRCWSWPRAASGPRCERRTLARSLRGPARRVEVISDAKAALLGRWDIARACSCCRARAPLWSATTVAAAWARAGGLVAGRDGLRLLAGARMAPVDGPSGELARTLGAGSRPGSGRGDRRAGAEPFWRELDAAIRSRAASRETASRRLAANICAVARAPRSA